jgi:hypothetical protein
MSETSVPHDLELFLQNRSGDIFRMWCRAIGSDADQRMSGHAHVSGCSYDSGCPTEVWNRAMREFDDWFAQNPAIASEVAFLSKIENEIHVRLNEFVYGRICQVVASIGDAKKRPGDATKRP